MLRRPRTPEALARLLRPASGLVHLDGAHIQRLPTRLVATKVTILPQSPQPPDGLVVEDLVARMQRLRAERNIGLSEALN